MIVQKVLARRSIFDQKIFFVPRKVDYLLTQRIPNATQCFFVYLNFHFVSVERAIINMRSRSVMAMK